MSHFRSGSNLPFDKSVEFNSHESSSSVKYSRYTRDSLEYKLYSSIGITVGLERVEGFIGQKGRRYYKCTLCSAHGNVEAMFRHLVGDKHTDKYIKSRLVLKNSTITADERSILKKMLIDKDDYGVHNIKTIYGIEFYPSVWEAEGKFSRNKKSKIENCPTFEEKNSLQTEKNGKKEIISGDLAVIKKTSAIDDFKYLIDRFKFIVATHCSEETRFERPEDLRAALIIMTFSLFWLHFTNRSFLKYDQAHHDHYLHQKEILTSCMGHVIDNLGATFNSKYSELMVVLKNEDEMSTMAVQRTKPTETKSQKNYITEMINILDLD